MNSHTPTPWIDGPFGNIWVNVQRDLSGKWSEIPGKNPTIVASVSNAEGQPAAANRALIVTAVNAYEPNQVGIAELTEALSEAALQIEYLHDKFTVTGSGESVLLRARAVLEKRHD